MITYSLLVTQALIGVAQFYTPGLLGGEGKAKRLYKWHRMSGYLLLILLFVTVGCEFDPFITGLGVGDVGIVDDEC